MKVSFITALYNRLDLTAAFIQSLGRSLPPGLDYELILLDAGSTDGTRSFLTQLADPHIRVDLSRERGTYAEMNNLGASQARGEILCLINNDVVLKPGWFEPLLEIATGPFADRVGIIGNVQWNPFTRLYDHLGVIFSSKSPGHFGYGFPINPFCGFAPWLVVTGACCVIRRDLFERLGRFDTQFVNGSEDIDLCLRLDAAGYTNLMCYDSTISHFVSSSPGRHGKDRQNHSLFVAKWSQQKVDALVEADREWCDLQGDLSHLFKCVYRPWRYNTRTVMRFFNCHLGKLLRHKRRAARRTL